MTPEARSARREQQRTHNTSSGRKQKLKTNKENLKDSLCSESIAMVNPTYVPEVLHGTPVGSAPTQQTQASDFIIPEFGGTPVLPLSDFVGLEEAFNQDRINSCNPSKKRSVSCGERQSLLARRNLLFESRIASNTVGTDTNPGDMAQEELTDPIATMVSGVINNGNIFKFIFFLLLLCPLAMLCVGAFALTAVFFP